MSSSTWTRRTPRTRRGTLAADGAGIRLTGAFDVPVKALQQRRHGEGGLQVAELRLDESRSGSSGSKARLGARLGPDLVGRTADDPRLKVAFKGRRLQVKQLPPSDIDVVAESATRAGSRRAQT